jgi:Tol biopolymer transport system component
MKRLWMAALLACMAVAAAAAQQGTRPATTAAAQFEAAQKKEVVDGDLASANQIYRKLADGSDRAVAAKALMRMGQCYEKLGATQTAESRKAYERVVRDFPDQKDLAEQARARLAGLTPAVPSASGEASSRRLWTAPRHATLERVSPDGRFVAWVEWSESGNEGNMVVHDLAADTDRRLTAVGPNESVEGAAFSRDGRSLAFTRYDGTGGGSAALQVVTLAGTAVPAARQLMTSKGSVGWVRAFDWTPDGNSIAVTLKRSDGSRQVALVSVDNGSLRPFAFNLQSEVDHLALSPDGRSLAFDVLGRDGRSRDIAILQTESGGEVPGVTHRADDALVGWTPDGTQLLFTSDRLGTTSLFSQRFAQGRLQSEPVLVRADIGQYRPLGVTSGGALFSYVDNNWEGSGIETGTFDFGSGRWIYPPVDAASELRGGGPRTPAFNPAPDWSPDGRSLSFVTGRGPQYVVNSNPGVVIRSIETNALRELRPRLASMMGLALWSPDGSAIATPGRDLQDRWGIYRIDVRTQEVSTLALGGNQGATLVALLGWSPDGARIYFRRISDDKPPRILTFEKNLATGVEREIFRAEDPQAITRVSEDGRRLYFRRGFPRDGKPPYAEYAFIERDLQTGSERELLHANFTGSVQPSPDGQFVAFATNDAGSTAIRLAPTAGGQPRELMRAERVPNPAGGSAPSTAALDVFSWAPDSRSILVKKRTATDQSAETWWVPVDGRQPTRMYDGSDGDMTYIRIHPDGRRVAFAARKPREFKPYEVWTLENFLPAKK